MTFLERRQRVTDVQAPLTLLEISMKSGADTLYLVNDTSDWTSNGQAYLGFPFRITMPDDVSGQTPKATIEIDNTGRSLTQDLEAFQPGDVVRAVLKVTDRADPDTIYASIPLPVTSVSVDQSTATASAGWGTLLDQRAVLINANPFTTPGIF